MQKKITCGVRGNILQLHPWGYHIEIYQIIKREQIFKHCYFSNKFK